MAWVFQDEATEFTNNVRRSLGTGVKALAPALWWWEVANVILAAERTKRLSAEDARQHLSLLRSLPIEIDDQSVSQAWSTTMLLARTHKLTSYDASYLELALRRGLPLASLDKQLRSAAKIEKVSVLPASV
jgi:predicted nucleic acid-binding protein